MVVLKQAVRVEIRRAGERQAGRVQQVLKTALFVFVKQIGCAADPGSRDEYLGCSRRAGEGLKCLANFAAPVTCLEFLGAQINHFVLHFQGIE